MRLPITLTLCACSLAILAIGCNHASFPEDALVPPLSMPGDSNFEAAELLLPLRGTMSSVLSGDTFELESQTRGTVTIRIFGIDAPEPGQPYADKARARLTELLNQRTLVVDILGKNEAGNTLGETLAEGERVAETLLNLGLAWHDSQTSNDSDLANLQDQARDSRLGLWKDESPVPPWKWRASPGE